VSHFTESEVDFDQSCEPELVQALKKHFGEDAVKVNDKGIALEGFHGDDRSLLDKSDPNYAPKCEIVIPRRYVGGASNDVGYKRNENGKYTAYISDYDKGGHYNKQKQGKVAAYFSEYMHMKILKKKGYTKIEKKVDEKGIVYLKASKK
jgi:Protein of unknown function (DUF1257)